MIKGHAVIELKDVATGDTQRVEHDNMITNGLKYCLTPWMGKFSYATGGASPQIMMNAAKETRKSSNRSMMNHLLGGIFLFQDNLEENVNNTSFPTDNPLTGKASWDAYNGMDTYRGSYNENESGLQDDGSYKHVWDFSTSQANGQISALALTTYKGGICGIGFKDWDNTETAIKEEPFFNLGQIRINSESEGAYCSPFIKSSSNEIYYVADKYCLMYNAAHADRHLGNSRKLPFKKKKFPLSGLSLFYDYYNQYYSEDVEIEVPEEFAVYINNKECRGRTSDSYLYIYNYEGNIGNVGAGKSFKLMRIRKSDLKVDVITLINNTPYTLRASDIQFTDDFCLMRTTTTPYFIYQIKIISNEIAEIESSGDLRKIGDYIYTAGTNYNHCIDPKTLEVKFHPAFDTVTRNWWYGSTEKIVPGVYLQFAHYDYASSSDTGYDIANIYISANILMTINNLPSPVIKTAAQTMKVTYIIQETEQ